MEEIKSTQQGRTKPKKNRLNQFLFFGGLGLIAAGIILFFTIGSYLWMLSVLGLIMSISVFFRKPKQKEENKKVKEKDNGLIAPTALYPINELSTQQELDQIDTGVSEYLDKTIKSPEDEYELLNEQEQTEQTEPGYIDYTTYKTDYQRQQEAQNKRRFRGKDGRIYFN